MNLIWLLLFLGMVTVVSAQTRFESDVITTSAGDLTITFVGHGSLMFTLNDMTIHVDPYGKLADYKKLPKADLLLLTHDHPDHLDPAAIRSVTDTNTTLVCSPACADSLPIGLVMSNGTHRTVRDIRIEAVPAYNIVHMRGPGQPFHPKGAGNGYVLTLGDKRVYVAGDTENVPEMKALKNIDIAFLPMNLPYTMTPAMVADAARAFKPKILYPYHFGETDPATLQALLKDTPDIEIRIRKMK